MHYVYYFKKGRQVNSQAVLLYFKSQERNCHCHDFFAQLKMNSKRSSVIRRLPLHYAASSLGNCQQENSIFKSHFLQVYLFQTKIFEMHFRFLLHIWVRVDCRPTSQQIYKRTSSNLIRKGTGCDEYVEDQLNVASKNFGKYMFDDTDDKRYLLHERLV